METATRTMENTQWTAETFNSLFKEEARLAAEIASKSLSKTKARALLNIKWDEKQDEVEAMVNAHNEEHGVPALQAEIDNVRDTIASAKIERQQAYIDYLTEKLESTIAALVRYRLDEGLTEIIGDSYRDKVYLAHMSPNQDLFNRESGDEEFNVSEQIRVRFDIDMDDESARCSVEIVGSYLKYNYADNEFYPDGEYTIESFSFEIDVIESDYDYGGTQRVLNECCKAVVRNVVNKLQESLED